MYKDLASETAREVTGESNHRKAMDKQATKEVLLLNYLPNGSSAYEIMKFLKKIFTLGRIRETETVGP